MNRFWHKLLLAFFLSLTAVVTVRAEADWQPLFNGQDLSGWVNVNTAPQTWEVRDGMIVCTGHPRGVLRTERMYENFILEFQWRHVDEGGNAGLFVHADALPQIGAPYPTSIEVQVMDGDHGSIFGIRGCTLKPLTNPSPRSAAGRARPLENRAHPAGQWNHYRLTSRAGGLELAVNGKVVTRTADASQVKGYICLESELAEVHFRNVRIQELPGSNPPPERVAAADDGFVSLFDGLTFDGWKFHPRLKGRWEADDGIIRLRADPPPRQPGQSSDLWTEDSYRDFVLIADWRLTGKPIRQQMNAFTEDGLIRQDAQGRRVKQEILHAGDSGLFLRGDRRAQVNIWSQPMGSGDINPYHKDAQLPEDIRRACVPIIPADNPFGQWNRFVVTMQGDRVTVVLNEQTVIDSAHLPNLTDVGAVGLQDHGDPIEFRNLFIKPFSGERLGSERLVEPPVTSTESGNRFRRTRVIGYSQVGSPRGGWYVAGGVFESIVGDDGWELLWNGGAGVDRWRDPNYGGWSRPLVSACPGDEPPDRVLLSVSGPYGSDEKAWEEAITATIETIREKIPSARQIILQPVVGGPDGKPCPAPRAPRDRQVRASWQHVHIANAIQSVVRNYRNGEVQIVAGYAPQVRTCDDYTDALGHLTPDAAQAAGRAIGEYYAREDAQR